MNKAAKFALGCLLAPVGLMVLCVVFVFAMKAAGVPDSKPTSRTLNQEVHAPEPPPVSGGLGEVAPIRIEDGMLVQLEMEEGYFTIESGPRDEGIEVTADFDEGLYDLTERWGEKDGRPVYELKFASKVHWLRRVIADGNWDEDDMAENEIHVRLPQNIPMELVLKIARSECEVDVTGLSLLGMQTNFSMGEFQVRTREPNPVSMKVARFEGGMGEFDLEGLSDLRADTYLLYGRMGEMRVDFENSLLTGAEIHAKMRMGEMRIALPDDAFWDPHSKITAKFGEVVHDRGNSEEITNPERHRLLVRANASFGSLVVDHFRPRPRPETREF